MLLKKPMRKPCPNHIHYIETTSTREENFTNVSENLKLMYRSLILGTEIEEQIT